VSTRPRRRWTRGLIVVAVLLAISAVVLISLATRATPYLRDRVVGAVNSRFQSQVALDTLQVEVFPRPAVNGTGLVLRHNGRTDVPPLIRLESFSGAASLRGLFASPLSLRTIDLDGLQIHIPPGGLDGRQGSPPTATPNSAGARGPESSRGWPSLSIDRIAASQARLEIASRNPEKLPRRFDIHDLRIEGFHPDRPATFTAFLTNPVPRGDIETAGEFGPWVAASPERTAVRGRYSFTDANLDTIKGIGGVLSSTGAYDGVLERISVKGQTDTPEFRLDVGRQAVPLKTRFSAVVDGTNGDTFLEKVDALLGRTPIAARGAVVRDRDVKGRRIALDVAIEKGRIEDVLRLAVDTARPPLTGEISLESKVVIPAGEEKVIDRLQLDGRFALSSATFTSYNVQKRIGALSRRARGESGDTSGESVVSNLHGRFVLRGSILRLTGLTFAVPGAVVRLNGTYSLRNHALDFKGDLFLDATLAETTSGAKAVIAKLFQPLFRGPKGGTKLPIRVAGTRSKPEFGLDVKRALTPGN